MKTYRVSLAGFTPINFEARSVEAESEEEAFKIVRAAIEDGKEDEIGSWDEDSMSDIWAPRFDYGEDDDTRLPKDDMNPDAYAGAFVEEEESDDDEGDTTA